MIHWYFSFKTNLTGNLPVTDFPRLNCFCRKVFRDNIAELWMSHSLFSSACISVIVVLNKLIVFETARGLADRLFKIPVGLADN